MVEDAIRPKKCASGADRRRREAGVELLAIRSALESSGPVPGYEALMGDHKIRGLGQAFGTKLLYFLSPVGDRALIADSIIAKAFGRAGLERLPAANCPTTRYARYLADMRRWADALSERLLEGGDSIRPEDLEMVMFGFNARPGSAWAFGARQG